jgi:hypothetical protein
MNEYSRIGTILDSLGAFPGIVSLVIFGFSAWMAVDCWRNGRETYWFWIILFTGGFGAFIYFLTQYMPGTRLEFSLWQRLAMSGRVGELKSRAHHLDNAGAYEELGDLYAGLAKWPQAEAAYRDALKRDGSSAHAQARLGYALIEMKRPEEAWPLLGPLYLKNPGFDDNKLIRQLARCQAARGNFKDARNLYEYFLGKHSYTDVQLEYAQTLLSAGDVETGCKVLQELIDDVAHSPKFAQRRDRPFVRAARRLLKSSWSKCQSSAAQPTS